MAEPRYVHGYDAREQDRLIAQAKHWGAFIYDDLDLRDGQRLLEIGCGAGAVLGEIGSAHRNISLAGIDIEPKQIERARAHLSSLGIDADLRAGDARKLPWSDQSFDHVYFMWMLEHLTEHDSVLAEARRVLKPGGRVTITETDYNFVTYPDSPDFIELMRAWRAHFAGKGDMTFARRVGPALLRAGFAGVRVRLGAFHNFRGEPDGALSKCANYHADYIEPVIESIAANGLAELTTLQRGVRWLRELADQHDASMTGTVYRATASQLSSA
jgi:ubiquinone/menaquinone biosynthesis C-methylase UbiE